MITLKDFLCDYVNCENTKDKLASNLNYLYPVLQKIQIEDGDKCFKTLKCFHEHIYGAHFNEYFGKEQVSRMYHTTSNGIVCRGEKFNFPYAQCIYKDKVKHLNLKITAWDVYVALNAQYHDHINEYLEWFEHNSKESLNDKIIEATINFWFMDEDAGNNKVWNYFKNIG